MTRETWRPAPEHPAYLVSDQGCVRGPTGRVLRPQPQRNGYLRVNLYQGNRASMRGVLVHRMVLEAFIGPCPPGMEACHGNGNRADNRLDNLRWGTRKENLRDRTLHGTCRAADNGRKSRDKVRGELSTRAKLTDQQVVDIRVSTEPAAALAQQYGVAVDYVRQLRKGTARRNVW